MRYRMVAMRTDARVDGRSGGWTHFGIDALGRARSRRGRRSRRAPRHPRRRPRWRRDACACRARRPTLGAPWREALGERARDGVPDLGRRARGAQRCGGAEHVRRGPSLLEREQRVDQRLRGQWRRRRVTAACGDEQRTRAALGQRRAAEPERTQRRFRERLAARPGASIASAMRVAPRPLQARTRARPSSPSATMPAASRRAAVRRASRYARSHGSASRPAALARSA